MKQIKFINNVTSIEVTCVCTLKDAFNTDENFLVSKINGIEDRKDIRMFYWLSKGLPYTLNELIFFAFNNDLCLYILDQNGSFINAYGYCGIAFGDFNGDFNNDYLR